MKVHRAVYSTTLVGVSVLTLVSSISACGKPSPSDGPTPTLTSPTADIDATPLTILSVTGGKVLVMKPGETEWVSGVQGMTLGVDYKIKTQSGGHAAVTFFEGSTIELEGSTEISLSELALDGTASHIGIEQTLGKTVSRVQKLIDPESSYEVETVSAIAAVRGTEFYVSVTRSGTTTVGSTEGEVVVAAQGVEVELAEGERTTVSPGKPPGEPEPDVTERGK